MSFVHLHNHSDFSLLRASSSISKMVSRAKELGMKALALTDDGNLFGALRFYRECKAAEIKPIIGCDFFMAEQSRHQKGATENANRYNRIVLLAKSEQGYRNLMKLTSLAYTEGFYYKPRIDKELLSQYRGDLIALSGSLGGEIPQLITRNRIDDARAVALWYKETFGEGNYYLELTQHNIPDQKVVNDTLIEFSKELDIPLVASNDCYYIEKRDAAAHDVLLCIGTKRKQKEAGRFKFSSQEFYIKSASDMADLFHLHPEAIKNTEIISDACNVEIPQPGPLLPDYEIPSQFENADQFLRHIALEGLKDRYETISEELKKRLDYELDIIIGMGFTGYFLIVWDFIKYAKDNDIPVGPGRGSGAGSIVAYAMTITDIDPIKYGLLFERFLNPDRISMPDFDIDFCFERRQEVIDYVTRKYGSERVGQIITFGTLKAKAVVRDVARVLDIPYAEADAIAKLIPDDLKITIPKALEEEEKLREMAEGDGVHSELLDISGRLEKLNRHASTHAAGVVIGKDDLTEYVPLFRDPKTGAISTQFTMDLLEDSGLVKMDFLGLKTLTLIKNTERLIQELNPSFSERDIPEDDELTFKLLGEGKSTAVFQFESEGMQQTLKKAKPSCIEDLIALNALYRPGPMDNIPQFIDSKWGKQAIKYPHPSLENVLKETYGVIVYQEQVMEIVQIIGGFSLGQADILRRAMGKKKEKDMAKLRVEYMEGASSKGISQEKASEIFDLLKPFAGYGFNKSHAAAYSVLAYKTAFLKANYPAQFMAANLSNEIDHPDKFSQYIAETKGMGIDVIAPDINISQKYFTVHENNIVFGLMGIKGIGSAVVNAILDERKARGKFKSFEEFLERLDSKTVNRKALEILIQTGSFRSFDERRRPLVECLDRALDRANSKKADAQLGQVSLFSDAPQEEFQSIDYEEFDEYELMDLLSFEKDFLGHYFSGHPMDTVKELWESHTSLKLDQIERAQSERSYQIIALITDFKSIITKKGKRMAFGKMEDYSGEADFVLFPETYGTLEEDLVPGKIVGILGTADITRERPQIIVEEVKEPEDLDERDSGEVHIRLGEGFSDEEFLYKLRASLYERQGQSPVYFHIPLKDRSIENEAVIRAGNNIQVASLRSTINWINELPGVKEAWKELNSVESR